MKVSDNFDLEEFVSKAIFEKYQGKSIWFLDYRIINFAEYILHKFRNEIIINNWKTGGEFQNRGYRTPDISGKDNLSQHKFGRAIDFTFVDIDPEEVRQHIRDNFAHLRLIYGIAAIETHIDWVHVDCRNNNKSIKLLEFKK